MSQNLKAVHDNDLINLLDSINLLNKFNAGKLTCAYCNDVINFENLHSIFQESRTMKLSCSKPDCVIALMAKIEKKQYE